jgi:hypothetical protein
MEELLERQAQFQQLQQPDQVPVAINQGWSQPRHRTTFLREQKTRDDFT